MIAEPLGSRLAGPQVRPKRDIKEEFEMAKGPAPKLFAVKKAEGNPGKRKLNPGPDYRTKRPKCPENLTGEGRRLFRQLAPILYEKSLLTEATLPAFITLCEIGETMRLAKAAMLSDGLYLKGKRGVRANPAVGMFNTAAAQFRYYLTEFGLTPASLQKVPAEQRMQSIADLIK